ncbi:MAG: hypothetical protein IKW20_02755 [Bacteroidales bacterium]|nr:hypothetical protein [Bacteroidales bacterium]
MMKYIVAKMYGMPSAMPQYGRACQKISVIVLLRAVLITEVVMVYIQHIKTISVIHQSTYTG